MDRDVGRIMEKLKAHGLDSNTLVFFTSDNGPCLTKSHDPEFFNSNGPFRGVKRDMNEGGIRVPLIARWPGKVPAGKSIEQIWAFCDLMPTLADFAGLLKPEGIDGISMKPALLGKEQKEQHEYLYWDYGHCRL
jgi:arylsulfatase A-like enzyme